MKKKTTPDSSFSPILNESQHILEVIRSGQTDAVVSGDQVKLLRLREVEEALRRSEAHHRQLLAMLPSAIYTCDAEGRITYFNEIAAALWGLTPAIGDTDLRFCGSFRLFNPDGTILPHDKTPMAKTLRTGESVRGREIIIERPDHSRIHVLVNIAPLRDSEDRIIGAVNIFNDITEHKAAEKAMAAAHGQIRGIINNTPDIVYAFDLEKRFILANAAVANVLGSTPEQMIGKRRRDFMPPKDAQWHEANDQKVIDEGRAMEFEEYSDLEGRSITWLTKKFPLRDAHGKIYAVAGISADISSRKQMEEALRASESFYRQTIESIPGMVFTTRADGYCDYQSCQWAEYTGIPAEQHIGDGWNILLHPDDRTRTMNAWRDAVAEKAPYNIEYRVRRHDGRYEWFKVIGKPIRDENGKIVRWFGVAANIQRLKETQEALIKVNDTLEERVDQRTARMRMLADQLRALASQLVQAEQNERKRLARILHDHIQQLLAAARMQTGWMKTADDIKDIRGAAQAVDSILQEAIQSCRSLAVDLSPPILHEAGLIGGLNWLGTRLGRQNGFTVNIRTDSRAEPYAEETRLLLFECAREILFNAVKHAGVEQADLTLLRMDNRRIRLIVSDSGKGFDPSALENRRPNEATFGLFSIRERLAHLGGRMDIESAPGRGTCITLTVPVADSISDDQQDQEQQQEQETEHTISLHDKNDKCRILICDDHKILREGLVRLFQFEPDLEVVGEAADGPEVIAQAGRLHPDIIIMDVSLGAISGVEASRRILAEQPDIKIIGLSMHIDPEIATAMRRAGAVAYFSKTGPAEDLLAAVRTCAAAS